MESLALQVPHGFSATYPSILALCLVAWVFILHRRSRTWTGQLKSNLAFARDRNAIIDSVSRDESLEAILNRVCSLVERYLPGTKCRIELIREGGIPRDTSPGGLPVLSASGKTVAIMRVSGRQESRQSSVVLDQIMRLAAQAIEQRRLYDRLLRQSPQSMLEGIVDPVVLEERLKAALSRAEAHGHGVALIHLGLESFEDINEVLGPAAGEVVLHCAAFRLLSCTRPTDHVARVGRDEFSIILTELHGLGSAEDVARRIVKSLDSPIAVDGASVRVGAAVGVCVFPDQASDSGEMKRRAHLAMYSAKTGSESQYSFYAEDPLESQQSNQAAPDSLASPIAIPADAGARDLLVLSGALPKVPQSSSPQ